jgi:hypothetical protein
MSKQVIATIVGFIATFIANTALAMTIIGPFFNAKLGISRNPEKDGLNFPAILGGYFLLTLFMVWLTPLIKGKTWLQRGLTVGIATGLSVNVASYLIVAGWSVADGTAMLFSAIIDSFATILGALVISYFLRNNE